MSDLLELPNYDVISNYNLVTPQSRGPDKGKAFGAFLLSPLGGSQVHSRLKRFFHQLTLVPFEWQPHSHGTSYLFHNWGPHRVARDLPSQGRAVSGKQVRCVKER